MITNYFKIAFRNLIKQKAYSLFNLLGLALGISCGLLLTLHIKEELSYEKDFPKHDRIYRVVTTEWSKSSPPLAGEMIKFFPEIKSIVRFADRGTRVANSAIDRQAEISGYFADSSVVEVFDLKRVAGNPKQALSEPNTIVLTKSTAQKFYGKQDPVGKKMKFGKEELWVKGVVEDLPENSHLKFDYLASMPTFYLNVPPDWTSNRGWMFGWTYVLFNNNADVKKAQARLKDFFLKYYEAVSDEKDRIAQAESIRLQPLTDIHLKSNLIQEMGANSSIIYIYIFIAVELLILIAACVNFINLFTTLALKRFKEVGIRKVLGARKLQLVAQFLGEAFILTFLAGIVAVVIYFIALPFYNNISGRDVSVSEIFHPVNLLIIAGIIVFVGFVSGLFPALFISRFEPVDSLKANKLPASSANFLRKSLIVFQFAVSGFLIISTVLVNQQMHLFQNKQLGFDKEQVLVVKLYGDFAEKVISHPEVLKTEILKNPDILAVGKSSNLIGDDLSVESVTPVSPAAGKEYPSVRVIRVDENYLNVLNIKLKEGRKFSSEFNDSASFIINEKAAQALELKHPAGAQIVNNTFNLKGKVIGVIKDYNFASLHSQIEPLVLEYKPEWTGNLLVKIRAGKTAETINFLQHSIEKISPNTLFSYSFLDNKIAGLYKKEDTMSAILKVFSVLAIIISCLGLFGLAAFATETRTKEIGIRKVIGASVGNLIQLLSANFILLVLAGNIIAWPLAWYAIHAWLQEFTYKIDISYSVFFMSAFITIIVAVFTIGYQCIKTANMNPVNSLRTE